MEAHREKNVTSQLLKNSSFSLIIKDTELATQKPAKMHMLLEGVHL